MPGDYNLNSTILILKGMYYNKNSNKNNKNYNNHYKNKLLIS